MKRWLWVALLVGATLYLAALSGEVYTSTLPESASLSLDVLLRKFYSIVAFTLVGFLIRRTLEENGRRDVARWTILASGLYSALIEVGQYFHGSTEGLEWNLIDVECGLIGGAIAMGDFIISGRTNGR